MHNDLCKSDFLLRFHDPKVSQNSSREISAIKLTNASVMHEIYRRVAQNISRQKDSITFGEFE